MANRDLTGIWAADDGGYYYVHQNGLAVWWAGFSDDYGLQNGLSFCNVFSGVLKSNEVSGQWADVPRGATMNFGTLSLTWAFVGLALPPDLPLQEVFDKTHKNTYYLGFSETLGHVLDIVKDSVVIYGSLGNGDSDPVYPFTNTYPPSARMTLSAPITIGGTLQVKTIAI